MNERRAPARGSETLSLKETLLAHIDDMRNEIVEFTKDLVRIPTINPPGEKYAEFADFFIKKLKEIGMDVLKVEVPEEKLKELGLELPRVNVIGTLKGSLENPVLHWNGHFDVVPPGTGWTKDPFNPILEDGKIYGRGTSDMKGGIAAMVMAAKALKAEGVPLKGSLVISASPDEEIGGAAGVGYIVKEGYAKGDMCIVSEPSEVDKICVAHKGALWLQIDTIGKSCHGSTPHLGINAIEKMAKIIIELDEKLKPRLRDRVTKVPMSEVAKMATLTVGTIQGGIKTNIVPDRCTITIDRRLIPEEKISEAREEIESFIEKIRKDDPDLKFQIKEIIYADAAYTSEEAEVTGRLSKAIEEVIGRKPTITGMTAFTDMRLLNTIMPTIIYGPGSLAKAHAADEYIEVESLITATKVFALMALDLLS